MRTVLIRIETVKPRIRKLHLREGTRVSDSLQALNVPEGYVLAHASNPAHPFPYEAAVESLIGDGEHLIARPASAAVEPAEAFTLTLSK